MANVLGKQRIQSIKDLNIKKYLIYTIGEVIIIVIGIFIALQFNEQSVKNENRKYIKEVLENIKAEAKTKIRTSSYFISLNAERDSAAYKILSNKLTINDYIKDTKYKYNMESVILTSFDRNLLNYLNKHIDYLNESEKNIYKKIQEIYKLDNGIETFTKNSFEMVSEHKKFQRINNDWYYSVYIDSTANLKEYNYRLNSFLYKNFVRDFRYSEIIYKSQSFSLMQCLSSRLLIDVINSLNVEKLKPNQIDSIFSSTQLKKLEKISCDSKIPISKNDYVLFEDVPICHSFYNNAEDTIIIRQQNDSNNLLTIAPKGFINHSFPSNTELKVFIKDSCCAKYITKLNSYFFYE